MGKYILAFVMGPVILVAVAWFSAHPAGLLWVAAVFAVPVAIGVVAAIGDLARNVPGRRRFTGWRYASPAARPRAPDGPVGLPPAPPAGG